MNQSLGQQMVAQFVKLDSQLEGHLMAVVQHLEDVGQLGVSHKPSHHQLLNYFQSIAQVSHHLDLEVLAESPPIGFLKQKFDEKLICHFNVHNLAIWLL